MSFEALLVIALGVGAGAICKGVTGMGLPMLALPIMASFFELPHAIAVVLFPAVVSNAWQTVAYRANWRVVGFLPALLVASAFGVALGTLLLTNAPGPLLSLAFGVLLASYVALRLARPHWSLPLSAAGRLGAPVGFAAGLLQGATGIAAPIIVTFLNAVRLDREVYIFTISSFYLAIAIYQLASLAAAGVLDSTIAIEGLFALLPVALMMPIGARLGRFVTAKVFDRLVLALLSLMAVRFILAGI